MQRAISTQKERVVSRGRAFSPLEVRTQCGGGLYLPLSITEKTDTIQSYGSEQDLPEPKPE